MAGDASFAAIRITSQNNSTAITGRKIRLFFRVLNRDASLESMPEDFPQATQQTEHSQPPPVTKARVQRHRLQADSARRGGACISSPRPSTGQSAALAKRPAAR